MEASVAILTHNQSDVLRRTLETLDSQITNYDFEIVITDDGSNTYHQKQIANELVKRKNKNIKYVWQKHEGMRTAKARNNALALINSPIVIFIDGDIVPDTDFVQKHIKTHHQNENNVVCCGRRTWKDISELDETLEKSEIAAKICRIREQKEQYTKMQQLSSKYPWTAFYTCNISYRKTADVKFDENFSGWGIDDTELAYKLSRYHGFRLIYNDEINVIHYDDNSTSQNPYRDKDLEKNKRFITNLLYFQNKYPNDLLLSQYITNSLKRFEITSENEFEKIPTEKFVFKNNYSILQMKQIREIYKSRIE